MILSRNMALFFVLFMIVVAVRTHEAGEVISTGKPLNLHTRAIAKSTSDPAKDQLVEKAVEWDPKRTALIICDMWDNHWCKGAAQRVEEMAGPMNAVIREARNRGIFIIHAPSTTVDFYKDTQYRKRAIDAKFHPTKSPLATVERWGTAWCYPDTQREPDMPIDDTDMGCDCEKSANHPTLEASNPHDRHRKTGRNHRQRTRNVQSIGRTRNR